MYFNEREFNTCTWEKAESYDDLMQCDGVRLK